VAGLLGLSHPHLDTTAPRDSEFGVGDPVTGVHQVELAGSDHLFGSQRVAVQRFAAE
jgi:hypothetical protein